MNIVDQVRQAGVVGAGGAGFPTWKKMSAQAECVIANGSECEPLLRVDQQLMTLYACELVEGMKRVMQSTGARRGIIALKEKYEKAVIALEGCPGRDSIEIHLLENYYPAGDEQALVCDVLGKIVPEGGIPLDIGAVVQNVGTLINIHRAGGGAAVTHRWLTVTGAVGSPKTIIAPVGTSVRDALAAAGGPTVSPYTVIDGGPLMGAESTGVVRKTTTSLIVLPADHKVVRYKRKPIDQDVKIARSACEGCRFCTDLCPRFLIGHTLEPHAIMGAVSYQAVEEIDPLVISQAYLCCQCGLCGMYACPTLLSPERIIKACVESLKSSGAAPLHRRKVREARPERDYRRPTVDSLVSRLELEEYDVDAPMETKPLEVNAVCIPLKQHVGAPCVPLVKKGDMVKAGQLIADIAEGKLGAPLHASITGVVSDVTEEAISIRA
ncbi:MAG: SLBB domain-containing protein [Candidatus Aureabacteria bacterium]|nr:SLBB domain-containing protein [Candidatus Auribacterota bacterium]